MILDKMNLFSDDQAVTATANSENIIDISGVDGVDAGPGEPIDLLIQVTTAFAGGTSIAFSLYTDGDVAFGSAVQLVTTPAVVTASLVAGYKAKLQLPKDGLERYLRLTYTVVGTMSAGKITAGLILDRQQQ